MLYTMLTVSAMKLAYSAHHGQTDRTGVPYIFHPYHLAEVLSSHGADEYTVCAALLHDTVEDTDVTIEQLEELFPPEVTRAVELLTHDSSTDYCDYVRAVKSDPIARAVKLADLAHNSDQSRVVDPSSVGSEKLQQWHEKYQKALEILNE